MRKQNNCFFDNLEIPTHKITTTLPDQEKDFDNPAVITNASHNFYKTKMCPFFLMVCSLQKNNCSKSDNCKYAHSLSELRQQPNLEKTKLCTLFKIGKCLDKCCKFAHCKSELKGTPDLFKTSLCYQFMSQGIQLDVGYCSYGDYCRFAHGENDLRKPSNPNYKKAFNCAKQQASLADISISRYNICYFSEPSQQVPKSEIPKPTIPLKWPEYSLKPSVSMQIIPPGFENHDLSLKQHISSSDTSSYKHCTLNSTSTPTSVSK